MHDRTPSRTCAVCRQPDHADRPLVQCYNPQCRQNLCLRHALSFELAEDGETHLEYFCSRACYIDVQRRALPAARELMIVLIVAAAVIPIYLSVVNYFSK